MIRVLQLPDSIEKRNGRMSVIMNVYRKVYKEVQFDFLCTDYGFENYKDEIQDLGGKVYMLAKKDASLANIRKISKRILASNSYNFVHYHALSKWGCALSLAHKHNIKVIVHSHATKMSDSWIKSIRNRIFSLNIFNADERVAVSPEAGRKLFLWQKFVYIPNMINYHKFLFNEKNRKKIRDYYNVDSSTVLIGCVGRISKQKNQIFAVQVLANLIKEEKANNYKLIIIGDNDSKGVKQLKLIRALIEKYNLQNNVIFTGAVNNIEEYYSAFDIFWLPSLFEGQPTVGVEAQVNGLTLLVSNTVSRSLNVTGNVIYKRIDTCNIEEWVEATTKYSKKRDNCSLNKLQNSEFNSKRILNRWLTLYK